MRTASGASVPSRPFATGSRRRDLLAFGVLLLCAVATAPLLRVYYRVTFFDVHVVRVEPGGIRSPRPVPPFLRAPSHLASRRPEETLRAIDRGIQTYMREDPGFAMDPPGTLYEWTVRLGENSLSPERTYVLRRVSGAPPSP